MNMDFFSDSCREAPRTEQKFGLCDDIPGGRAYSDHSDPAKWLATVVNQNEIAVVFTAIDKCVIQDHDEPGRGRCDGMLTADHLLYMVELKDRTPPWQADAIQQLESTILFLKEHHDIQAFTYKKAFACNKQSGKFVTLDNEANLRFFRKHGFRLDLQSDILIVPKRST
ncbi:MAG: hypothetical protein EAZ89_13760 [Bacteroidetes bacterium]|nr:MAG: hypothetical protein EAZ89_13760 [Bacteroidota bacterium]